MKILTLVLSVVSSLALTACGGGGGGTPMPSPGAGITPSPSVAGATDPNSVVTTATQSVDLRWGAKATPTVLSQTDNVQVQFSSAAIAVKLRTSYGYWNPTYSQPNVVNATIPLGVSTTWLQGMWITSDVKAAWAQGWTGAGIKVGVLDDFVANSYSEYLRIPIATGCTNVSSTLSTCSSSALLKLQQAHGDQVAMIVGGGRSAMTGVYEEYGGYATTGESGSYSAEANMNTSFSSPQYGVAKDAEVVHIDYLNNQSNANGIFSVFKGMGAGTDASSQNYRTFKVVNLSFGGSSTAPVANTASYAAQLAYANTSATPDAVFVKAAGNFSCVVSQKNCDPLNAVFYYATPFKDKSILVGALTQAGGLMAGYSNKAGNFADRFVVADGRGIARFDGVYDEGTSFAAPRVSGYAAILRQKFPNLNAAMTSSVILDTASWNSAWGAKNAGTQAIYGQGEANLGRALAPVGTLR
jgi:hypothetical protein